MEKMESFERRGEIEECVSSYRRLQVLHLEFTRLFTPIVLPTIYQYSLTAILLVTYCLIRFHDKIPYSSLFVFTCIFNILLIMISAALRMGSSMYVDSVSFIQAFKPGYYMMLNEQIFENNLIWRIQIRRSLMPLKIRIGRITFMQRSTSMAIFSFIFYVTMRLVVRIK